MLYEIIGKCDDLSDEKVRIAGEISAITQPLGAISAGIAGLGLVLGPHFQKVTAAVGIVAGVLGITNTILTIIQVVDSLILAKPSLFGTTFEEGGTVPGVGPIPAILHGGEFVLSQDMIQSMKQMVVPSSVSNPRFAASTLGVPHIAAAAVQAPSVPNLATTEMAGRLAAAASLQQFVHNNSNRGGDMTSHFTFAPNISVGGGGGSRDVANEILDHLHHAIRTSDPRFTQLSRAGFTTGFAR